ncbi:DNA helicase PcrA [Haloimpatiens massiliensis]|uniref:DNA helicase PcrA n=1 Tax=Haloimpatiens massiliensis TaxID=1658110 RepID=UPI000C818DC3|nr:DNA helicase PcrA [Haloimpatiens massiliensis]
MELKKLLNREQYEAASTINGPLLILAGAGSGKTRVLTYRIAHMIQDLDIYPSSILAITFTNKAAGEMKERIKALVGDVVDSMWVSTFHSSCVRILRREIDKIGYNKNFAIYDTSDQKVLMKECMKELNINDKDITDREILGKISDQKNNLISAEKFKAENERNYKLNKIADVYLLYQKKLKSNNALDFDDLIFKTVELLKKHKEVLEFYQRKFKYIMVDEYQDTNRAQYELVKLLAAGHRNICVVGDDDQCIYQWRGADIRNILDFEKDYDDAKVVKLEQNYRSKANILNAANEVIRNNAQRKSKVLRTEMENGEKINIYRAYSDMDEAMFVCKTIKNIKKEKNKNFKDFAILYRTNAQSRIFEDIFIKNAVPYRIIGGLKFYDRKEIKDILAYLKLINNPVDDVSLKRIINVPKRAIGDTTVDKVQHFANAIDDCLYSVILDVENVPGLSSRNITSINKFTSLVNSFIANKDEMMVSELIEEIIDKTGYLDSLLKTNTIEDKARIENLKELVSAAVEFENTSEDKSLFAFLEQVTLVSDIDNFNEEADSVVLMTVHSAKGLEFPVVFMVGMENGVFPGMASLNDFNEMEESRRLCYVGITRAKEQLYMTSAESRRVFGRTVCYEESDFIAEIPLKLRERVNLQNNDPRVMARKSVDTGLRNNPHSLRNSFKQFSNHSSKEHNNGWSASGEGKEASENEIVEGRKVRHSTFGVGTVVSKKVTDSGIKITVVFDNYGIKNLMYNKSILEIL